MHSVRRHSRLLAAALALAATAGCKPLDDAMVTIFGRSMRDQRSFDPYENPQPRPGNVVPFAMQEYPGGVGVNIDAPGGVVVPLTQQDLMPIGTGNAKVQGLVNPIEPDSVSLARGQVMYERFCLVCHGAAGIGAQAPIAQKHPTVAAYNLAGPVVQGYTDQYIYGMIRVGRGLMPDYGSRITELDRWRIVNYVRVLQEQPNLQPAGGN